MKKTAIGLLIISICLCMPWLSIAMADVQYTAEPSATDLSKQDAIDIARDTLCASYVDVQQEIDHSTVEAEFGNFLVDEEELVWRIIFTNPAEYYGSYCVLITGGGEVRMHGAPATAPYYAGEDELSGVTYVVPSEHDISEEKAVQIAFDCINEIADYEKRLDQLRTEAHFVCGNRYNNGFEPVWIIYFYQDDILQQKMLLAYDGTYMDTVPAECYFTKTVRPFKAFDEIFDYRFDAMTFEEKAAFSAQWIPVMDEYLQDEPYCPDRRAHMFYNATRQVFGLPGEQHISKEDATRSAFDAIVTLGASVDSLSARHIGYSFDVTDPENPLWVLVIYRAKLNDGVNEYLPEHAGVYEVKINAFTGDVVKIVPYEGEGSFDGYYY